MLINFNDVNFSYGDNLIFKNVNFSVNEGERIALVGENGVGKTTLLKLITGELYASGGEVIKKNGIRLGYLAQNGGYDSQNSVYDEMKQVFKEELDAVEKLFQLSARLALAEYDGREYRELSARIEALEKYISSKDCYGIDVKIKTVLNGMGFSKFYDRKISDMSGGEKTRFKLARLLLERPDLLILDEPTNHLDVSTLYWLENYIESYKGAVLVVSHDRYFLDRVALITAEIENKTLNVFKGGYTKYKILKAERYERELKEYEKQREELLKLQTYVDKNIVRATTAKSAQSRVKQIKKTEVLQKPYTPPPPPRFTFSYEREPAEEVLRVTNLTLEIGGKTLLQGANFTVRRGQKTAIIGENGAGKSTLIRAIASGENRAISVGRFVKFAYYDQEMANLNARNTVLAELWDRHAIYTQTEARKRLAECGLSAEDMFKTVEELSGGERAKLAMCVFESADGNVLLLDEPTNHLDLPARESLEKALKEFDGTVIFVSHDRYFITALADRVIEIEGGKLTSYECGYTEYRRRKEQAAAELARGEEERAREEFKEEKARQYRSRKDRAEEARIKAEIKDIERDISLNEQREAELNQMLANPETAANYAKLAPILEELNSVQKKLEALYEKYGEMIDN